MARNVFVIISIVLVFKGIVSYNVDVKTRVHYNDSDTDSLFGFSVNLYREGDQHFVLVGAPTAEALEEVVDHVPYRPGRVYNCTTRGNTTCTPITFDVQGQDFLWNGSVRYQASNKSLQWFGASLTSINDHKIAACAPLYVNFGSKYLPEYETFDKRESIGECFVYETSETSGSGHTITKYSPCKTENMATIAHYNYTEHFTPFKSREDSMGDAAKFSLSNDQTMCQAGGSIALTGEDLIIGAVGSFYWQGQVIIQHKEALRTTETPKLEGHANDNAYKGYTVVVGNFSVNPQTDIALSVPRASSLLGEIELYTSGLTKIGTIKVNASEAQMGEYFGYSMVVGDFNGDGLDDIAVGAPMFAKRGSFEDGRVHIYLRTYIQEQVLQESFSWSSVEGRDSAGARFGLSLAVIGDIDKDGFTDLAVGAPYEGSNSQGALYIFRGSTSGIKKFSQIIEGRDMILGQSFGFSVAGDQDMDSNGYPDIAVGAFREMVYLRSRPVVRVEASLTPSSDSISLLDSNLQGISTSLNITTCFNYTARSDLSPRKLELIMRLDLDGRFESGGTREIDVISGITHCSLDTVYVLRGVRDKLSALWINMTFELNETAETAHLDPILNLDVQTSIRKQIEIENDCGDDGVCVPQLVLDAYCQTPDFVYGSPTPLVLTVTVSNEGEASFQTTAEVHFPEGVNYNKAVEGCNVIQSTESGTHLSCDAGNPLLAGHEVTFNIEAYPTDILPHLEELVFRVNVSHGSGKSNQTDEDENLVETVQLKAEAVVALDGQSNPGQVSVTLKKTSTVSNLTELGPELIHKYWLTNEGPSDLSSLVTTIYWPELLTNGMGLFYLHEEPIVSSRGQCTADILSLDDVLAMPVVAESTEDQDKKKELAMNCNGADRKSCKVISCDIDTLGSGENVFIEITSRVFQNNLAQLMSKNQSVVASSSIEVVNVTSPYNVQLHFNTTGQTQIRTQVVPLVEGQVGSRVVWWHIVAAVLGGVVLLAIFIGVMCKCGFFKRTTREDLIETKRVSMRNSKAVSQVEPPDKHGQRLSAPPTESYKQRGDLCLSVTPQVHVDCSGKDYPDLAENE